MEKIILIKIYRGVVQNVKGLPRDWTYEVVDFDDLGSDQGEFRMAEIDEENCNLGIAMKSGIVWEVGKLPRGYKYKVSDIEVDSKIKGGRTMKKRRIKQNPSGIIYLGLGTLVVGGVVAAIFLLRKKNGGSTSGKTTLTQAEIAGLYQQWLEKKQTNPGGVTGWLDAILAGVNNAKGVVDWFNAQKSGGGQQAG
jgi:hypothetical protein